MTRALDVYLRRQLIGQLVQNKDGFIKRRKKAAGYF